MEKRSIFILGTATLLVAVLYYIDAVLQVPYFWKAVVKILALGSLFGLYGGIYGRNVIRESAARFRSNWVERTTSRKASLHLVLGALAFGGILLLYYLIAPYMHMDQVVTSLLQKYRIGKEQILYYGLYLSFGNALLEEMLFRGYLFLELRNTGRRRLAYLFSSMLFSLYHISNIQSWFNPLLFVGALVGLMLSGLLFCYLTEKGESFFNSYFVHLCADLAIVVVGFRIVNMYAG